MSENLKVLWSRCLALLEKQVPKKGFETWFLPLVPLHYVGQVLTLQLPDRIFEEWLEEHYKPLLSEVISEVLGPSTKLSYHILASAEKKRPQVVSSFQLFPKAMPLQSSYTFEHFITGKSNELTKSAARDVAKRPGKTAFNPLMIHGDVGLGKTHIIQAIAHDFKENFPKKRVLYVTTEDFTNHFIQQLRSQKTQDFIDQYRSIDLLIVDDLQFLSGKVKTQEIFFYIFNHLHQAGKQLVMTSDMAPSKMVGFEKRLLSRFKWGLTTDLKQPDLETRIKIMEHKLINQPMSIAAPLLRHIASRIESNIRELEGVLNSLIGHATLHKKAIDLELVNTVLEKVVGTIDHTVKVTIPNLQKIVAQHYKIKVEALRGNSRKQEIVLGRHLAIYLAKKHTNHSLKAIGLLFGKRDLI